MRLIDADALSIRVMDASYYDNADEDVIWSLIQDAPTVDAVPVVRCKDCAKGKIDIISNDCVFCYLFNCGMPLDGFCSRAERRDEE